VTADRSFEEIAATLKLAVSTLRDARVSFALGGSFGAWARGGPRPCNDLDLMVKPRDAERALEALGAVGMRTEKPPEEWLFKAWHGEVMIDLIFYPAGLEISDEVLGRAQKIPVLAVATPVMALEDILQTKLLALGEHALDYSALLGIARTVREQIDWPQLRARTCHSPYAAAFFTLTDELGIAPRDAAGEQHGAGAGARVRVIH
jgi:hypothetical protein